MSYKNLKNFIDNKMSMSHIYQPLFIKELIKGNGSVNLENVAKAFLSYDKSQIEYYEHITKTMPRRILKKHGIIEESNKVYTLADDYKQLTENEAKELIDLCNFRINDYLEKRSDTYDHRKRNFKPVSGSKRYKVIQRAKGRCESCGASAKDKAIDVDHIVPQSLGGSNDESNLQALCYECNRAKRNSDNINYSKVQKSYNDRDDNCLFCNLEKHGIKVIDENELALAFHDGYPVTPQHTLVIPKRHVSDYFELHQPEINAINELVKKQRENILKKDKTVTSFNIGANSGVDAGQSIFHVHVHLIPRRKGDMEKPKGGVRGVIPEKQADEYIKNQLRN